MDKQSERTVVVLTSDGERRRGLEVRLGEAGFVPLEGDSRRTPVAVIAELFDPAVQAQVLSRCQTRPAPALVAWGPLETTAGIDGWLPTDPEAVILKTVVGAAIAHRQARLELERLQHMLAAAIASDDEAVRLRGLAAIGEASLKLNHDINNPLCSISLNAQLLLMLLAGKLEQKLVDKLRAIEANADRIRQMTQYLGDVKQKNHPEPAPAGTTP